MEQMKKLGSMKSIMGMIPGMNQIAKQMDDIDLDNSEEVKVIKAMVSSMTPKERENPNLLNNSRRKRIAKGAGLSQIQVNRILKQFRSASKLAKRLSGKNGLKQMNQIMQQMKSGSFPGGTPK